ncbi:MAG TPA: hypothetical protein VGI85_02090 [Chthoniobacterales bacterium]|jgi:hypothetical protein
MEPAESPNQNAFRSALIAGGCVLIALAGMFFHSSAPAPASARSAPPAKKHPVEKAGSTSWASGAEPRVTFAHTMPRARGSQIFDNTGMPNLEMIKVAIPDDAGHVRFVRGSDPEAIAYLQETKAEQKRLVLDTGPADVSLSEIADLGPLKGRATRRLRNLAADKK